MAYFDAQQTGKLMAVTSDVGSILGFVNSGFLQLVNDLILSLGVAVLLVWLQWRLALIALVAVPLYAVNQGYFSHRIRQLSLDIRAQVASIYALLSERVSAVRVVRSFAKEEAELAELDGRIDAHRTLSWANTRTNAYLGALATLISGLGTVGVLFVWRVLVGRGACPSASCWPSMPWSGSSSPDRPPDPVPGDDRGDAGLGGAALRGPRRARADRRPPGARPIVRPRGGLSFRGVSFAYSPDGPLVLDRVDLEIEPGMTVGLLGPSGAGKSTLLALAPRLYDLAEGRGAILFDGQDVRDLRLADVADRSRWSRSRRPVRGDDPIEPAVRRPGATAAHIRRPWRRPTSPRRSTGSPGLETPVGERGQTLSGGRRQRWPWRGPCWPTPRSCSSTTAPAPRLRDRVPRPRRPGRPPPGPDPPDRLAQGGLRPASQPDRRPGRGADRRSRQPRGPPRPRRALRRGLRAAGPRPGLVTALPVCRFMRFSEVALESTNHFVQTLRACSARVSLLRVVDDERARKGPRPSRGRAGDPPGALGVGAEHGPRGRRAASAPDRNTRLHDGAQAYANHRPSEGDGRAGRVEAPWSQCSIGARWEWTRDRETDRWGTCSIRVFRGGSGSGDAKPSVSRRAFAEEIAEIPFALDELEKKGEADGVHRRRVMLS